MSQPELMKSRASQSRSSGCVGGGSLDAEVLGGGDDSTAKEHLPVSIHRDARGQRMMGVGGAIAARPTVAAGGTVARVNGGKRRRA